MLSLALPLLVSGQELPADVLAKNRWTELTHADYESALGKLPAKYRWDFATSPKRVQDLLNNLLITKTLAAQARVHGAKPLPPTGKGPADDADRGLAAAELQRIEADASKAFDARKADYEAHARETYMIDRGKYQIPEEVRLSDIAIAIKERGPDAALARAREARERIVAGGDFGVVAREYSDDAKTKDKGGALPFVSRKDVARRYADAAFALKPGEISEPIRAPAAYHIVRLEERRPARDMTFEEAHDSIMDELRSRYIQEERDRRIEAIYRDPELRVNQARIDALVNRVEATEPQGTAEPPHPADPTPAPVAPK